MLLASRRRRSVDIWPGFVDALAALLMVVIFVLLLFSLGQFLLTDALVGRDAALDRMRSQIAGLTEVLALERKEKSDLQGRLATLSGELEATLKSRDVLQERLSGMTLQAQETATQLEQTAAQLQQRQADLELARGRITANEQALQQQRDAIAGLEGERERLQSSLDTSREETAQQQELVAQAQTRATELNAQIAALNEQLAQLNQALEASEAEVQEKNIQIEDLGQRLNLALARKVEELASYRSEFFGKLREALKDHPDIRIEGDRFVLPSEVLFSSASADLDKQGAREIATVARTLKEITAQIPGDVDWVLRVDGHTDRRPIRKVFASNWELSSARAISIVKYMIGQGIPAENLVAAGFAHYHPLDPGDSAEAYRRNRRIELKLTSR